MNAENKAVALFESQMRLAWNDYAAVRWKQAMQQLEIAHIVGQAYFARHWRVHAWKSSAAKP